MEEILTLYFRNPFQMNALFLLTVNTTQNLIKTSAED